MYVNKLILKDFRNYEYQELELSPYTNVIYGNNAQGKTNILEAVHMFSQGRSNRTKTDKELVRFGCDFARIAVRFVDSDREYNAQMQIMKTGKKKVSVNHILITKLSRLMNYLNVVMFSPEDLNIVKGSPSIRRRFMDSSLSQLYPSYMASLTEYNKALLQKNSLLKAMRKKSVMSDPTLSIWNEQLAKSGAKIMNARIEFVRLINKAAQHIQNDMSGESLCVKYMPSIKCEEPTESTVYEYLCKREKRETEMVASMYGIQRDDLEIFVNNYEARLFASQGQQRTAALSMKIAQSEYIRDIKGEYPVLLLDDIMSELDINRRAYLSERIKDKQVLITCTDADLIDKSSGTQLFHIQNGRVIK